ncbi:MAG TPA: glycosyltransferase family 2 protein [Solirubrobacteraceae bacterium]|jgi:hypothetical protein|nr:glycosyltransferase family 2 protein [Solirubrobacteraceae bacterium]
MKLVMTLLVRNEADIVRANLDYHLAQGVDFVIVTDHGSEDGTSEILREYERMGVAQVHRDEEPGHHQSRRVTRMAELARVEHGADWVIHNDADEFWWPQLGSLRDVFASLPARYAQIVVARRNFRPLPDPEELAGVRPFYSRLNYRETNSLSLVGQPKIAHRPLANVVVAPGNHSISPAGLPAVPGGGLLEIFHFPMRSYEQFERKVVQIGLGYERVPDRSPGVGRDQLELLGLQRAGRLREYYDGLVLDDAALQRGMRAGAIVLDRRLEHFICDLPAVGTDGARADAPFAGQLLERMMGALAEVEQSREELAGLRTERERASARIGELHAEVREVSAALEQTKDELRSTSEALSLLRSSRLLRHTAWLRRLYYSSR